MVAATVGDYTGAAPFHTYYMTVSGHLRYTFGGNFIARMNRDLVADLPLGEHARAYLATQIELDRALELLLKELEAAGSPVGRCRTSRFIARHGDVPSEDLVASLAPATGSGAGAAAVRGTPR